jgi:sporulation protein YlmC with PRC-barrel domain
MKVPHQFKSTLLASALAATFAMPALAQQYGQQQTQPGQQQEQQRQQQQQQQQTQQQRAQQDDRLDVRASRLIGMDVRNPQGENLGNVSDLVLDTQNNRVHYVVLSHGGLFGIGDNLFAFPMQSFAVAPDLRHLVLNVDRATLRDAEGFDRNRWPDLADDQYWGGVDRRFGQQPATGAAQPQYQQRQSPMAGQQPQMGQYGTGQQATREQQLRQQQAGQQQHMAQRQANRRASELMRANIVGIDDRNIGNIDDIVIDVRSGDVKYAVVAFDRGWFTQDRLVALPLNQFQQVAGRNQFQLPMTQEQVAQAPGFERSRWADVNEPGFRTQMDRYAADTARTGTLGFGTPPAQTRTTRQAEMTGMQQPGGQQGLTFDQLSVGDTDRIRRNDILSVWNEMDRNNDGSVTREEFNQYVQQQRQRQQYGQQQPQWQQQQQQQQQQPQWQQQPQQRN